MNFTEYTKSKRIRRSDLGLATGHSQPTIRARCADPGNWSVYELINIAEACDLDLMEILQAVVNSVIGKERTASNG